MRKQLLILAAVLAIGASGALAAVTYTKDWADYNQPLMNTALAGDLLEGATATVEAGSFYAGLGSAADLTDGTWGTGWGAGAAILRDYAGDGVPAVTLRYDFPVPTDITEIRVFASNPDGYNGRSYHNYDVEYKLAGDPTVYTLMTLIRSTEFGAWNGNTEFVEKTATYVYDDAATYLLQNVEYLRFKLYDTGNTTGGFFDPYDPTNPLDLDGNLQAVEGSGIREIDVLPEPASFVLLLALAALRRR